LRSAEHERGRSIPERLSSRAMSPPHIVVTTSLGPIRIGDRIPLCKSPMIVGRTSSADILIPSDCVARRHCRFEQRDDVWWIVDVHATGGTYVNDVRVDERALAHGDCLRLGDVTLTFEAASEVNSRPRST
jgi:pSer/pThr/pTyr-binding forkhead associated (FHA) protein